MNKLILTLLLFTFSLSVNAEMMVDELIVDTLQNKNLTKPISNLDYNYDSTNRVPVKLSITETVSTKSGEVYDGKKLIFKVKDNVIYNNETVIKKDSIAKAHIASYTTRGMNGIPASIIVEDFNIKGIDKNKMTTSYIKYGVNLSALVLPLKWALTFLPPFGSFTNFIIGTNAKINPNNIITLYYYPEWNER